VELAGTPLLIRSRRRADSRTSSGTLGRSLNLVGGIGLAKGLGKLGKVAKVADTASDAAKISRGVTAASIRRPTAGLGLMYGNEEAQNPYITGLAGALMAAPLAYGMAKE